MSVIVNQDYPTEGALRAVDERNDPIEGVAIRIYDHTAFFAGTGTPVAETITDAEGNWVDDIPLEGARTWVVHFQKSGYGPTHDEVTT
jgi:hypothetical protein